MKNARTFLVVAATLMAGAGAAATTAAAATVVRETITLSASESGLTDDCRPGITGDLSGEEVIDYQGVETATGFHFTVTDSGTGRIDWSDGSYTLIESVDHYSFNAGASGTTVSNLAHQDSGNTYAEDGTFLFRGTFHEVERFTFVNGVPRVEIQRGHFHFSSGC
jgi:hypothetical protein